MGLPAGVRPLRLRTRRQHRGRQTGQTERDTVQDERKDGPAGGQDERPDGDEGERAGEDGATPKRAGGRHQEVADPEESKSYPARVGAPRSASSPSEGRRSGRRRGGAIQRGSARGAQADARGRTRGAQTQRQELTPVPGGESIGGNGTIPIPPAFPKSCRR
jgi:hypothetical protein